ncbi:MAG: hypothetical protein M3Q40_01495 [Pseudomonadota bacterium]|nr:hypothetical protein [Pseudomonadota bacterium]
MQAALSDINRYGVLYQATFVDELVRYQAAPRELVIDLLRQRAWAPGDVYYACALARQVGRPCRHVVERHRAQGAPAWGAVSTSLGVAPGSPQAQRLKRGVEASYGRWARPLDLIREVAPQADGSETE